MLDILQIANRVGFWTLSHQLLMTTAISVENVWKSFRLYHEKNQYIKAALLRGRRAQYEEFWAVNDANFDIPFGTTFGIIGANGSGKSTLLKCIAGILTPEKGNIQMNGRMSALLELGAGFHPELSGRENVFLNGAILGMTNKEINLRYDDIVEFSGLGEFINTPVKNYSSGMVVRLGFAIATNVDPEILIIDEVLAVGDQEFQQRCFERIEHFRTEGRTIVLVSHGLGQIEQLCNKVAWLEKGVVRALGPAYDIVSEYNGVSHDAINLDGDEIGIRWGSGEAEITKIDFLDEFGNHLETPHTGKPLVIRIAYKAHTPLKEPVLGLRIDYLHGARVFGATTRKRGVIIPEVIGEGYVDLVIPNLPLLEGIYDVSVSLTNASEIHIYDHWEKRSRFAVSQRGVFDGGLVTIDSHWNWQTNKEL
jgi:ABC-2 type transport system ATP-binding protein